jgi:hypothetical protein
LTELEDKMIRNHVLEHNILYVGLFLAFLAVFLVVNSLAVPAVPPVAYPQLEEIRPAPALNQAQQADANRLNAIANAYKQQRARMAEINRWNGLANTYTQNAPKITLNRAHQAYTTRLQSLAYAYFLESSALTPAQLADAARWTGVANSYGVQPGDVSPALQQMLNK